MEYPFAQEAMQALVNKFPFLNGNIAISRKGNKIVTGGMDEEKFRQVLDYAVNELGFTKPHEVVGVDDNETLGAFYLFSDLESKVVLAIKVSVPRDNPVLHGLTKTYPNLFWHERELVDLFGFEVLDLPEGPHYPLPDIWPAGNYPMRKDWDPSCFDRETMTYTPKPKPAAPDPAKIAAAKAAAAKIAAKAAGDAAAAPAAAPEKPEAPAEKKEEA